MSTDDQNQIKSELTRRLEILENAQDQMRDDLKSVSMSMNSCLLGCGLDAYKDEMKQRCQRLSEKIDNNKEILQLHKTEIKLLVDDMENNCNDKWEDNRTVLYRIITTAVVVGIFFGGIIGTLQIQKVSQSEYNNHLNVYQLDKVEQQTRFDHFLETYTKNQEKRDKKMDDVIEKQQEFNEAISKRNIILEGQLNVIKTKLDIKH